MGALDAVSVGILLAALLILAGILSSLVALRFGAPLLLVFLLVGMLAGEAGPLGIRFDDVRLAYTIGSVALALILFDGGLRTRYQTFRNVIGPAGLLSTIGVLVTAALTAPAAVWALGIGWTEALLVGAVVASTDAAAVFFLLHAKGLRLRPRVSATLEVESGINDPFAIFLTIVLIEIILHGAKPWYEIASFLVTETLVGALIGYVGGRGVVLVLNRLNLPQGLHAPFVATGAVVIFALAEVGHGSGFLAVYVAGLVVGNSATRAHNAVVTFLDAATWLAQIGMFVVLGLLVMAGSVAADDPAGAGGRRHADVHRAAGGGVPVPCAVSVFNWREKTFMSWVGLRGAVGIFIASIPMLVGRAESAALFRRRLRRGAGLAAGAGLDHRAGGARAAAYRSRAAIRCRAGSSSTCRASSSRRSSAIRSAPTVPICGAARCRPGRGRRWWCATSASSARPKPIRCARATTSISWRRPSGRRRSTASLSTCRRRRGRTRCCSATSSSPASTRSASLRKSTASRLRRRRPR